MTELEKQSCRQDAKRAKQTLKLHKLCIIELLLLGALGVLAAKIFKT